MGTLFYGDSLGSSDVTALLSHRAGVNSLNSLHSLKLVYELALSPGFYIETGAQSYNFSLTALLL